MAVERFNPEGVYREISVGRDESVSLTDIGYSQVTRATGDVHVHVAGIVSIDVDGELVGPGDLPTQVETIVGHVDTSLSTAGAEPTDVVNVDVYALDPEEFVAEGMPVLADYFGRETLPAITVVGVTGLAKPDYLVEIETEAIVEAPASADGNTS